MKKLLILAVLFVIGAGCCSDGKIVISRRTDIYRLSNDSIDLQNIVRKAGYDVDHVDVVHKNGTQCCVVVTGREYSFCEKVMHENHEMRMKLRECEDKKKENK